MGRVRLKDLQRSQVNPAPSSKFSTTLFFFRYVAHSEMSMDSFTQHPGICCDALARQFHRHTAVTVNIPLQQAMRTDRPGFKALGEDRKVEFTS